MHFETLSFKGLEIKAGEATEKYPHGYVRGYASTRDVDSGNDKVLAGAFRKTLAEGLKSGKIKLVSSHNWSSEGVIGVVTEAKEDEKGLLIEARFSSVQAAQDTRVKISEGILDAFSIGYSAVQWKMNGDIRELSEVRLYEVSVVPWGMNQKALITGVKSAADAATLNELKNTLHLCNARTQMTLAALRK